MEGILFDITGLKRVMEDLKEALRRRNELETIIGRSPVVAILWRVGPGWPVEYVSENVRQFGYAPEELLEGTIPYWTLIHPEDRADVLRETASHVEEGHREYIREYRFFTKSGDVRWIEERAWVRFGEDGAPSHLQGILLDVTDRRKALEELEYLSLHDMLTGLYNRAYFEEEMRRLDSGRFDSLGIVVLDVDGLKLVNDMLGHAEGDRLLRRCAELLRSAFRRSDVVARIGGDEFAVLLPGCDERVIEERLKSLFRAVEVNNGNEALYLSLSLGYAVCSGGGGSVWSFFREADDAMYRHKRSRSDAVRSIILAHLEKRMSEDIARRDGDGAGDACPLSMPEGPQ
jgi:diguanylate cyclase (GGDEF)-like protein/PAS domain S-box-containing protein